MNNSVETTSTRKDPNNMVRINQTLNLTKNQYEVLNIICNTSAKSIPEYIHKALVQTMQSDIEYGNFADVLLDKLDDDNNE